MKKALVMFLVISVLVLAFAGISNAAAVNTISIHNQTGFTFYAVFVKPSNSTDWGNNLISYVVYNGESFYVDLNVYRPAWDIAVKDRYGTWHYWRRWDLNNCSGITLY
ncbi:MAG: hypothetical protein ACM3YE_10975 [Bacteroidota bacterium]